MPRVISATENEKKRFLSPLLTGKRVQDFGKEKESLLQINFYTREGREKKEKSSLLVPRKKPPPPLPPPVGWGAEEAFLPVRRGGWGWRVASGANMKRGKKGMASSSSSSPSRQFFSSLLITDSPRFGLGRTSRDLFVSRDVGYSTNILFHRKIYHERPLPPLSGVLGIVKL